MDGIGHYRWGPSAAKLQKWIVIFGALEQCSVSFWWKAYHNCVLLVARCFFRPWCTSTDLGIDTVQITTQKNNQTSFWSLLMHQDIKMTSQEYQTVGSSPSWLLLYRSVLIQWNTASYNTKLILPNTTIFGTLKMKSNDTLFMPKIDTTNTLQKNITVVNVILHPNENQLKRFLSC